MPTGTGYTSISDYLSANAGTLQNERAALQGMVGGEYDAAKSAADQFVNGVPPGTADYTGVPGYSHTLDQTNKAQQDVTGLGTYGGLADLIGRHYGARQDQAQFDANLLGPQPGADRPSLTDYLNFGSTLNTESIAPGPSGHPKSKPTGPRTDLPPPPPPPTDTGGRGSGTWDHPGGSEDAPWDNQNPWGGGGA